MRSFPSASIPVAAAIAAAAALPVVAAPAASASTTTVGAAPVSKVLVGKTYTFQAIMSTQRVDGVLVSPVHRTVYIYVNGFRRARAYTVAIKGHPGEAKASYRLSFSKPGTYVLTASFSGAADLNHGSTTKGAKVVAVAPTKA